MKIFLPRPLVLIALMAAVFASSGRGIRAAEDQPFLHPLFCDNMILQRDMQDAVWGWTTPGAQVKVTMGEKTAAATAGPDGRWLAKIGPFTAGGPYTLTVEGPKTVTIQNVAVGDIWTCSGQSNMAFTTAGALNAADDIAKADFPQIRLFGVPGKIATEPQTITNGTWQICSPKTVGGFSAVGFFFGRKLNQDLKIPIGLIGSSWGGTVAEAWTSAEALKTMPDFVKSVDTLQKAAAEMKQPGNDYQSQMATWWKNNDPGSATDPGWADPAADVKTWKTMKLPQSWKMGGLDTFDGIVWFRKDVQLADDWAGKDLGLQFGGIDGSAVAWFNGTMLQANPRVRWGYLVPGKLVKAGANAIVVRILGRGGSPGLTGKPEAMSLDQPGHTDVQPLPLAGDWLYQDTTPLQKLTALPQSYTDNPNYVTVLYNGMIAPLLPFSVKGAIWYQGESNNGRAMQYRKLLPTLIQDWRTRFGGDFPFYIVQLAGFTPTGPNPSESGWAEIQEAQLLTSETVPNTGLAVASDIGDPGNIHPKNKQEVGRRLALAAEGITYKLPGEYSGPVYKSMKVEGDTVRLTFDHVGGGLVANGGVPLKGFAIKGDNGKFVWADAKIDGDTVVVSAADVKAPTAVRYAWGNILDSNLYNKEGLPASPFRTDIPPTPAP